MDDFVFGPMYAVPYDCPRIDKKYFDRREFSFTLLNEVYLRYQSFSDAAEFESETIRLCPEKFDIGAVYSHRVRSFLILTISTVFFFSNLQGCHGE